MAQTSIERLGPSCGITCCTSCAMTPMGTVAAVIAEAIIPKAVGEMAKQGNIVFIYQIAARRLDRRQDHHPGKNASRAAISPPQCRESGSPNL